MKFKLVTPDRVLADKEVKAATLPTADGEITVLPGHALLASLLVPGIIKLQTDSGTEEVAVSGGFINVGPDGTVDVLADTAEQGHELDLAVIEQAKERAKQAMKEAIGKDDTAFAMAAAALERELSRFKLAMKHKATRHTPTPHGEE